jgi:MATE family multidrug resistance protein
LRFPVKRFPIELRTELKDTLKLAGPITLNQVGHMSMGLVDTLVAGHISTVALAGLGLASNFYWTFTSVCVGCLFSLDTLFSQAVGAQDKPALQRYLAQSLWSCAMVTAISAAGIVVAYLVYMGIAPPSETRDAFASYLGIIVWCLPSLFLFFVLQRYWQARHRVLPFSLIIILANMLNLVICVGLGLGHWGLPRLGVQGLAIATVISRYAMLLAAMFFTLKELKPAWQRLPPFDWLVQRQFLGIGLPAAGHLALEIGAFTIATFVVSALGPVPLAAHHISLMMASFTFMFPVGLSSAAAVRVGMFVGARQPERARASGWLCIALAAAVMTCFALGYLFFRRDLLGAFTPDPAVIDLGTKILVIVALFQIADGLQVSTTGALRGLGNTRSAMFANLIGHYPIGLALGFFLCFKLGFGALGLWAGLALGLICVASLQIRTWARKTQDLEQMRPVVLTSDEALNR